MRIGLFEDYEPIRSMLGMRLLGLGYEVPIIVGDGGIDEAMSVIAGLEPDMLNAAIVDGNLGNARTDEHGVMMTDLLHKIGGITVIGFSGSGAIPGADYNVRKPKVNEIFEILIQVQAEAKE